MGGFGSEDIPVQRYIALHFKLFFLNASLWSNKVLFSLQLAAVFIIFVAKTQ